MHCTRKITKDITWVGGCDRRLSLFEATYPVPDGVTYNSYLLKTQGVNLLFDTVDDAAADVFGENIEYLLKGEPLHYVVVHHLEPDHSATLHRVIECYPGVKIICNAKTAAMMGQFLKLETPPLVVAEGETFTVGSHELTFVMAPMVHWPEVMMTFDKTEGVLFSADAFGHFGTFGGEIFADAVDFERDFLDEARRYYTNIVGKYGAQVQTVLKKAAELPIKYICPLHGLIWRKSFEQILEKYTRWSLYRPEEKGVLVVYGSIYGGTANAANILAAKLSEKGIKHEVYDVSVTHSSYLVAKAFKYSHLVSAGATYNNGLFIEMDNFLRDLAAHGLKGRTVGIIENGSWAPAAAKIISNILGECKDMKFMENTVSIKSRLREEQEAEIEKMAEEIENDIQIGSL